jgi:phospholipid/cholesterol/gamma-HCH transport system substrate-binding protein
MEPKANFVLVGIFTVIFTIIAIVILLWMVGIKTSKQFDCYLVKTNNSVSGLHKDSSVQYKGVSIGKVKDIRIDKENSEFIDIYIDVEKDLPVKIDTKAKISSNGLTGISYINLIGGRQDAKLLKNSSDKKCPIIKATPSTLEKLSVSASSIMVHLNGLLEKIDKTFDNNSINYLRKTVENIYQLTNYSKNLISSIQKTNNNINTFVESGTDLADKLKINSDNLNKLILNIDSLTNDINSLVKQNSSNISNFTATGFENFNSTLTELNSTLYQLKNMILTIQQNPSIIIKGKKIKKGPGE